MMKKLATIAVAAGVALMALSGVAQATKPDPEHKVGLCHRTASDSNPYVYIEVDEASLPAHLNDLPGHPAKPWKTDGTFRGVTHVAGDLKEDYVAESADECLDFQSPSPTPTTPPPTTPPPTTPPPTTPPPTSPPPSHTWTPTWTPSHVGPPDHGKPTPPPLAMTGFSAGKAALLGGLLLVIGLGSLYLARRRAL